MGIISLTSKYLRGCEARREEIMLTLTRLIQGTAVVGVFLIVSCTAGFKDVYAGYGPGRQEINSKTQAGGQIAAPDPDRPWKARHWQGRIMGFKVKGSVERRDNDLRGVVSLRPLVGKAMRFAFTGKIDGDKVTAGSGGHVFQGRIRPDGKVAGKLSIKNGPRIPLTSPAPLP